MSLLTETEVSSRRALYAAWADEPYPGWVCVWQNRNMTQTPESRAEPTTVTGQPRYDDRHDRPSRLSQVLAWVAIIAGVVFVVAVIFFSGFFLSWSSDDHYGWHRGYGGGRAGTCPMMGPGGMGPGGPMGPQQSPPTTAPTTPRP
jgi:hypothetical protein